MNKKYLYLAVALLLGVLIGIGGLAIYNNYASKEDVELSDIMEPVQTSGRFLSRYMSLRFKNKWDVNTISQDSERHRLTLSYDIYIKARSFAMINKIFFIISVLMGIVVLIWPSIAIVAPETLGKKEIFKSAVVQTTVTALAALSFFIYSDYKDKQMSAENLMRYVVYSDDKISDISKRVMEELSRIDKGFNFYQVLPAENNQQG